MDTLTHALSGALIARATAPRGQPPGALTPGRRMAAGFLAAAFPDIDVVVSYLSPLAYLYYHRGATHSIIMLPVWAVLLAVVFAALWRWKPGWRAYAGVAAWGIGIHIAGDWITSFGTMLAAPFSDARYALSATFIIDLWFTGIILIGLFACAIWRSTRVPAMMGVAVLAGYVGFQWMLQQQAIEFGRQHAAASAIHDPVVSALPRPVSPFNWTVVVTEGERYHYAHVNLIRRTVRPAAGEGSGFIERLDAPYQPLHVAVWQRTERYGSALAQAALAREAYSQPDFRFFRWFAAYPVLVRIDTGNPEYCAWFEDLRFVTPGRGYTPFRYGMCRENNGPWQPFRLTDETRVLVY